MIHFFDRQVHRGYAVFDTCTMVDKRLYLFDKHMDRFFNSMMRTKLSPPCTKDQMKNLLSQIAVATGFGDLYFRLWCSRGGSQFNISAPDKDPTVFYIMALPKNRTFLCDEGIADAYTVSTEVKGDFLASVKTTNYLLNSMAADEAAKKKGEPVFVTEDGYVTEAAVDAITFITKDKTYYTPPCVRALRSITQERGLELAEKHLLSTGKIKKISRERKKIDATPTLI